MSIMEALAQMDVVAKRMDLAEREGTIKRIHVNQHMIRSRKPNPITIQTSAGSINAAEVIIKGESKLVYQPDDPLSCGARLWVETTAELEIYG